MGYRLTAIRGRTIERNSIRSNNLRQLIMTLAVTLAAATTYDYETQTLRHHCKCIIRTTRLIVRIVVIVSQLASVFIKKQEKGATPCYDNFGVFFLCEELFNCQNPCFRVFLP